MPIVRYTPEQAAIEDFIIENDGIVLVAAGAGTGKSWLSDRIVRTIKPTTALYTAFNKAIVLEGVKRFEGTNVECRTFHSLALKYVKDVGDIETFTYTCITENLSYAKKLLIINAIDSFFVSSSVDMYEYMDKIFLTEKNGKLLKTISLKYIEKMISKEIHPTFNFLLKYFHLMLVEGKIECKYDLVIIDEINDVTAVFLEIFKLIKAPKKLGLGETHQAIYQFLNLVDGFELLNEATVFNLTQSFRCNTNIALKIQEFMQKTVTKDFKFIGTDNPVANNKSLYCTATNAAIVLELNRCLNMNKGFTLLRKPSDIFACPLALITASSGREPYQKKYKFLTKEFKRYQDSDKSSKGFYSYIIENVDDEEVQNAARVLISFRKHNIDLFDLYKKVKAVNPNPEYTVSTVFTSKGLEFETVIIADDLNKQIQVIHDNGGIKTESDITKYRCYYVACSRCGVNLVNAKMLT